ncbi:MAG: right-handed parallel beta-helix repeat-containing protein [Myxococcales bacterium]|nr:right-handed parallel beta-helix repeat-containing protein [Myxococcales bacterium]MCB9644448.1 right-handed parallel beta-helix repeat-containing protein [Myxococcales bacterium]
MTRLTPVLFSWLSVCALSLSFSTYSLADTPKPEKAPATNAPAKPTSKKAEAEPPPPPGTPASMPATSRPASKPAVVRFLTPQQADKFQETINQSNPGDTILLRAGIYRYKKGLQIHNVDKLSIEGQGEVWIIVEDLYDDVFQIKDSSDITIRFIKARHARPLGKFNCEGAVIRAMNSKRIWIDHCELNGSGAVGIRAFEVRDLVATHNFIHHNTLAAFMIMQSRWIAIHHNTIVNNGSSIYSLGSASIRMNQNVVANNKGNNTWSSPFTRKVLGE